MKTCVLISGLPRHVKKGFDNIYNNIIKPNNADVFIHTWNNKDGTLDVPVEEIYNPKSILIENQKEIHSNLDVNKMIQTHARYYTKENFIEMLYSSWYSIWRANWLKEEYRLKNNIEYHYSIRIRFDINYSHEIICSNYDPNIIHISNRWLPETEMTDDRFAFGGNKLINSYCGGINLLDFIHAKRQNIDQIFCGETIVYENLKVLNIQSKKIETLEAYHVRD